MLLWLGKVLVVVTQARNQVRLPQVLKADDPVRLPRVSAREGAPDEWAKTHDDALGGEQ